jgi:carbon-monoxide dehydrogenase large subunit
VKGVGEAGTIASTPAVVNAVVDAVRHLGINDIEMPCTPHRVWTALRDASAGDATPRDVSFEDNAAPSHNAETSGASTEGDPA